MDNKSVCMLCNAELISLCQPPAEYGYLCSSCKTGVLRIGKNQIDRLNEVSDTIKELKGLPLGAFSAWDGSFGKFPISLIDRSVDPIVTASQMKHHKEINDMVQQQRLYNDTASMMIEEPEKRPISPNPSVTWQKQSDVEKGQLFASSPACSQKVKEEYYAKRKRKPLNINSEGYNPEVSLLTLSLAHGLTMRQSCQGEAFKVFSNNGELIYRSSSIGAALEGSASLCHKEFAVERYTSQQANAMQDFVNNWPWVATVDVFGCIQDTPCHRDRVKVLEMIVHLEDRHGWERNQILQWLEKLETAYFNR